jgi:hypothetical protein
MVAVLFLVGLLVTKPRDAMAMPEGYVFTPIAFLDDPAPGAQGGTFVNDFEPGGINNEGDVVFTADVSTGGEGVFLRSKGQISEIMRMGEPAPGGGIFDFGILGPASINDEGDVAVGFLLTPFSFPIGVNSGLYLFSHTTRTLTSVVVPGVTPAPSGGTFAGVFFGSSLNNRGHIIFPGIVETDQGIHIPSEDYVGLGEGLFRADQKGKISNIVIPGDPAPGGGKFDWVSGPAWLNDRGDLAFIAHVAGEECSALAPQEFILGCLASVYVRKASGEIQSIAHAGDPAPGGGMYRQAYAQVINNRGDIAFLGDLTPAPDENQVVAAFLHTGGVTIPLARPGDPMPGGGHFVSGSNVLGIPQIHVNNLGQVVFNAILDTDVNGDGILDTGLFAWSHGTLRLVARTGTVIPGVGTVDRLAMAVLITPPPLFVTPNSGAINNDRGQVYFGLTLADGRGVLLVATPR